MHDSPNYRFHSERLDAAERLLFPKPCFGVVAWFIVPETARLVDDLCEHEDGCVQMGLCREVGRRDVRLLEISLVPEPRDKRCRTTTFEDDDGTVRDCFTGRQVPDEKITRDSDGKKSGEEVGHARGRRIAGYAYRFETLRDV